MVHKYDKYTSHFKHNLLQEYRPGIFGCGFKALAKRFKIKGGHKLIMRWYHQWDGTVESLNHKTKGHRRRTMLPQEVIITICIFFLKKKTCYFFL